MLTSGRCSYTAKRGSAGAGPCGARAAASWRSGPPPRGSRATSRTVVQRGEVRAHVLRRAVDHLRPQLVELLVGVAQAAGDGQLHDVRDGVAGCEQSGLGADAAGLFENDPEVVRAGADERQACCTRNSACICAPPASFGDSERQARSHAPGACRAAAAAAAPATRRPAKACTRCQRISPSFGVAASSCDAARQSWVRWTTSSTSRRSWSGPGSRTSSSSWRTKPYVSGSAASGDRARPGGCRRGGAA